jgi:Ulp1 family protease
MSKEMTPMKRLSGGLVQLRDLVSPYCKELTLNKAAPAYNPHGGEHGYGGYSKGVESDFILIFKSKMNNISFALAFNYIDVPVEKQTVAASIKKGESNDDIISSTPMSLDAFKEKLNRFNKNFRGHEDNASLSDIVNKFSEILLEEKLDLANEIKKADKKLSEIVHDANKKHNVPKLNNSLEMASSDLENAQNLIRLKINEMPESEEIKKLEAQLAALRATVSKREKKLKKDLQLDKLEENQRKARHALSTATSKVDQEVNQELRTLPGMIANKLKPKM